MSTSELNNSMPPSPDAGDTGDLSPLGSPWSARLALPVRGQSAVSPGSQMQPAQPHVQYSPPAWVCPANATELNGPDEFVILANAGANATNIATAQKHIDTLESFILWPPQKESGAVRRVGLHPTILLNVLNAAKNIEEQTGVLIRLAELAYGARDYVALNELSRMLLAIPFRPAQKAATYYQAVLFKRAGQLDQAAEMLVDLHHPRAVLTLATIYESKGKWTEAVRLHVEMMRRAKDVDVFAFVCAALQLATFKAVDGDHARSLVEFQSLGPIVRTVAKSQPYLYPLWCNALAVEFTELGRVEEARAASAVATASPFVHAYPEWQETAAEITEQQVSRSIVSVTLPQDETDAAEQRPPLAIQHRLSSPRRLPLAPPSPTPAHLLTCAPIHGPHFRT